MEVEARVRDHLQPGETLHAAAWVSRPDDQAPITLTRAELSPLRFRRRVPDRPGPQRTLAAGLEQHLRLVTEPRVLARTDRRLLVLSRSPQSWLDRFRAGSGPLTALHPRWECPRANLNSATDRAGRLRLIFTDGSVAELLIPAASLGPFLAG